MSGRAPNIPAGRTGGAPRRGLLVLALAIALGLPAAMPLPLGAQDDPAIGNRIAAQKDQLKQVEFERQQIRQRLEQTRNQERDAAEEIETLSQAIRKSRRRVSQLAQERQNLQARLEAQDAELQTLEGDMSEARTRIGHRLRRLYRFSKTSETASLFTLVRFKTLFKDSQYLARLKREDEQAISHIRELHEAVTAKRKDVEQNLIELALLTDELKGEQATLSRRERQLRGSLKEMRTNQGVYNAYLKDLNQVMTRMESAIATLEARGRQAARRQAPADFNSLRGKLEPPVTGRVVAEFGKHDPRYQLKKFQRGMVIRTDQDAAPVKAVASGQVVHAGPFRGYQDLVVLDHGGGIFSVYGHLSDLQVRRGTRIEGGTVLGTATYQPVDEGYSVYFEMRRGGKPVDPMTWINGKGLKPAAQG